MRTRMRELEMVLLAVVVAVASYHCDDGSVGVQQILELKNGNPTAAWLTAKGIPNADGYSVIMSGGNFSPRKPIRMEWEHGGEVSLFMVLPESDGTVSWSQADMLSGKHRWRAYVAHLKNEPAHPSVFLAAQAKLNLN